MQILFVSQPWEPALLSAQSIQTHSGPLGPFTNNSFWQLALFSLFFCIFLFSPNIFVWNPRLSLRWCSEIEGSDLRENLWPPAFSCYRDLQKPSGGLIWPHDDCIQSNMLTSLLMERPVARRLTCWDYHGHNCTTTVLSDQACFSSCLRLSQLHGWLVMTSLISKENVAS